jgi:hypothetical protein
VAGAVATRWCGQWDLSRFACHTSTVAPGHKASLWPNCETAVEQNGNDGGQVPKVSDSRLAGSGGRFVCAGPEMAAVGRVNFPPCYMKTV